MKTRKHFIPVVVVFVLVGVLLVSGLLAQASIEIEELFPTGEITDRRAFLQGMVFAQEEINDMRREGHLLGERAARDEKELLVGLEAVWVIADVVGSNVERYGLTQQLVQTDAELRLRTHGIKVAAVVERQDEKLIKQAIIDTMLQHWHRAINAKSDEDFLQCARELARGGDFAQKYQLVRPPGLLGIKLLAGIDEESRPAAFSIEVKLEEGAYLMRNGASCFAPVWERAAEGTCSTSNLKDYVRECLRDYLDEFINDYLAANPTRSDSERDGEQRTQGLAQTSDPNTDFEKPFIPSEKKRPEIERNVSSAPREWRMFETTAIEGWVKKVERGTIFKTISGNIYEVVDVVILFELEVRPDVTILTDGELYKLFIKGVGEPLLCRKLNRASHSTPSGSNVIEATITGTHDDLLDLSEYGAFTGVKHGNIYKLSNGQVWEQTDFYVYVRVAVMPQVTIWQDGPIYRMKVDGVDRAVTVRQLK